MVLLDQAQETSAASSANADGAADAGGADADVATAAPADVAKTNPAAGLELEAAAAGQADADVAADAGAAASSSLPLPAAAPADVAETNPATALELEAAVAAAGHDEAAASVMDEDEDSLCRALDDELKMMPQFSQPAETAEPETARGSDGEASNSVAAGQCSVQRKQEAIGGAGCLIRHTATLSHSVTLCATRKLMIPNYKLLHAAHASQIMSQHFSQLVSWMITVTNTKTKTV